MKRIHVVLATATLGGLLFAIGCSEANDDTDGGFTPPGADATTGKDGGSGSGSEAGGGGGDSSSHPHDGSVTDQGNPGDASAPGDAGALGLVINEVCGKSPDFVEIFNPGTTAVDIADWGVTEAKDHDSGPGSPKSPALFAGGTKLAAGEYAVVYGAPKDGGLTPTCPATLCLQATWNISNSSGATAYLLNAAGTAVAEVPYPAETVGDGQSWGRLPNGTGAFAINTATPGKANESP